MSYFASDLPTFKKYLEERSLNIINKESSELTKKHQQEATSLKIQNEYLERNTQQLIIAAKILALGLKLPTVYRGVDNFELDFNFKRVSKLYENHNIESPCVEISVAIYTDIVYTLSVSCKAQEVSYRMANPTEDRALEFWKKAFNFFNLLWLEENKNG